MGFRPAPGASVADLGYVEAAARTKAYYDALYSRHSFPRGALGLRFDDNHANDLQVYGLLRDRGLPGSFAVNHGLWGPTYANKLTKAQALEMQANGMEITNHSYGHTPDQTTDEGFLYQVVTAAEDMRDDGICVQGFVQPGTYIGANHVTEEEDLVGTLQGRVFPATFASTTAYIDKDRVGLVTPAPLTSRYGRIHLNVDPYDVATVCGYVDRLVARGGWMVLMWHSAFIGVGGISWANFEAILDYIAAKRDVSANGLEVMTQTASMCAVQNDTPYNYCDDPTFERSSTGAWA